MAYMTRLGLWGAGTSFPAAFKVSSEIESGGVGAMEMVSRDMKSLGMYLSGSISFGVDAATAGRQSNTASASIGLRRNSGRCTTMQPQRMAVRLAEHRAGAGYHQRQPARARPARLTNSGATISASFAK